MWIVRESPGLTTAFAVTVTCVVLSILALAPLRHDEMVLAVIVLVGGPITVLTLTARRRIADLERTEQRLRSLLSLTSELIWEVDLAGNFTYLEGRVKEFSGFGAEELLGKNFLVGIDESDRERIGRMFLEGLPDPISVRGVEMAWRHRDGSLRYVDCDAQPLKDRRGQLQGFRGVVRDVTEPRKARQQAEALLAHAKECAEAASHAKSEFLANMSHEIRTPMTAILGFTELLVDRLAEPQDVEATLVIQRNARQLLALLDEILDLSKIEAGKMKCEPIPCSPWAVVRDVVSLMEVRAQSKGLYLEVERHSPIPEVIVTDPGRLRQILINLVGNAIKFTEAGGVRVAMSSRSTGDEDPQLEIEVIDTGIGITAEQLSKLFRPFTQADATMTRRFGGTGLGLSISKRLAAMLGGDITAESAPGQGSTFRLSIAMRAADWMATRTPPAARANEDLQSSNQDRLPCRVLLVEDGLDNQRLIAYLLRRAGADVTIADDGRAALQIVLPTLSACDPNSAADAPTRAGPCAEPGFDVILMDIQMPVMDGAEATRRLRAAGFRGPIIALTAHAGEEDRQRCLAAGCSDHLAKPIEAKTLLQCVGRYAPRRAQPAEVAAPG